MKRIVLIGDIVSSKQITDRALIQERLAAALEELNNRQDPDLASPYTITLGDEFQAVFDSADALFCDAISILLALHPEQVWLRSAALLEVGSNQRGRLSLGTDTAFRR